MVETYAPERLQHIALSQRVVASLRRAIILGELPPELHLEEPALAAKFGVSRIPIREALTRLAHEGLVRLEPRRGAFVVGADEADIRDIYEFRLLLELDAARRAVRRLAADDIAHLQALTDRMRAGARTGQFHLIGEPDVAFHEAIVQAAGSRRLQAAWEQIAGSVETLLGIADTTYRDMNTAVESHQAILDALAAREATTVERLLRQHLEHGAAVMCGAMRAARANPVAAELTSGA